MSAKQWLIPVLLSAACVARAQAPAVLSASRLPGQTVQLTWPAAGQFVLQEAASLGFPTAWQAVTVPPVAQGNQLSLILTAGQAQRYFRLISSSQEPLTLIASSSPADGESGVSVTRETVLHFSNPLAAQAPLDVTRFSATFGQRRLLSRVELSSDRRKASLFQLEPLPGGARITVTFDATGLLDEAGREVDADGDGLPGGTRVLHFDTYSLTPVAETAVIGQVFASDPMPDPAAPGRFLNRPLSGATITVDGREQELRTTTDANGRFRLAPVPAGRFFVHVDGRTAAGSRWPDGEYYPVVGKAWEAVAGRDDNLAGGTGEIFLPLIKTGTLQTVSTTADTPITFPPEVLAENPSLDGVTINVPANSLFGDDGTRGGKVGIAPVPPDRLPEPLPPGLNLPLVITVQTDGPSNFDRPVPVRFPNLPDPASGTLLPPGAKSALWSFNHDLGRWEIIGPMTVSADGKFVETDPGVGIQQPGWHGSQRGSQGEGGDLSDFGDGDEDGQSSDDIDGDGIPNGQDDDVDGDGIPNGQDDDVDGDGVPNSSDDDIDGDGLPNDQDGDDDGDGVPDEEDAPSCEEGQPCDDGDPCTTDDRCINGQCVGTPIEAGTSCGPPVTVVIDKTGWVTTENNADAGGNYTSHLGFSIAGGICLDPASKSWTFRPNRLNWNGKINVTLAFADGTFSIEPNPVDGGNVTEANYCAIIADMAGYLGRGRGTWHLKAASRNHENHHRDIDWPGLLSPVWNGIQQALLAESVPCDVPADEAQAILQQRVQDADALLESEFTQAVIDYNSGHDGARTDEAYQAGQNVLNFMIDQIRTYAQSKGWAACPGAAQPASTLARPVARHQAAPPRAITRILATAARDLLDPGESAPITVSAFQGNAQAGDVSQSNNTVYRATTPGIIRVSPTGVVTGLAPGVGTVLVEHFIGQDQQPLHASIRITVRSPRDQDNDGMPDSWERDHGLNPADPADAFRDADGDGVINRREFELATNPRAADTDGDGRTDHQETLRGTSPRSQFNPRLHPSRGLHYFVLMNLATGRIEQRGIAGANGKAHAALIMAPQTRYRQWVLRARDLHTGTIDWISAANGQRFELPAVVLRADSSTDADQDALSDAAEFIVGTDPQRPDTDGDGVPDGAEVKAGADPSDGVPVRTGVIDSADTPGTAVDVSALNHLVAVADSAAGVAIFDIRGLKPILAAQVDTPGNAQRVAWSGNLVAVADGAAGLAVIDAGNPAAARLAVQAPIGNATAVAAAAGLAWVGLQSGRVVLVDMATGTSLRSATLGEAVQDLVLANDYLYVLTAGNLHVVDITDGTLEPLRRVASPVVSTPNSRLSVGGGVAYAVHGKGFNTFDLSDPADPKRLAAGNTTQFGWEHIVPNGSGLGMAAVGSAFAFDRPRVFSLYDLSDPKQTDRFVAAYPHPGHARAVALFNGVAYGAAHDAGLQVINYLAADLSRQPPALSLAADFPLNPAQAEEGKLARLTALATDDVQVRNVEFYLNDVLVAVDGNFPFEHRFVTPRRAGPNSVFTLRAVAFDTGGNKTETPPLTVQLVADATAPRVVGQSPERGQIVGAIEMVGAFFNEPVDLGSLTADTFTLESAGPDGLFGTADDSTVPSSTIDYRPAVKAAFLKVRAPLAPGFHRARVRPPVADLAGNPLAREVSWDFLVLGGADADGDGVPDSVEALLGLDPNNPDSNGNGISDGDEDPDRDRLRTAWELAFGLDPRLPDSNQNQIPDGDEDADRDGLTNFQEQTARTHPMRGDSDADGWPDEGEVTGASNPLDPTSTPALDAFVASPAVRVTLPAAPHLNLADAGLTLAPPPLRVLLPAAPQLEGNDTGLTVANPSVGVILPHAPHWTAADSGLTLAQPPVRISLPAIPQLQSGDAGTTLARPPVTIRFLNN